MEPATIRPPRMQRSLIFEVTQRCNHDCLYCYNAWKNPVPYPSGELSTTDTLALLGKALDETGARLVSLSGGEPLARPDIHEVVAFLRARGVVVNLITNGTLLTAKTIELLVPDRISVFELPLLSVDRAIHDRMSGKEGAFDRVVEAMVDLKLAKQRVVGVFVATRLNLPTWRRTVELAVALGLDGVMFNRFNPGGRGRENVGLLQASPGEIQSALDVAEEASARYGLPINCSIAMPPCLIATARYKRLSFGFCAAGTERAYYTLDPLGNVRPCNHTSTILGNLRECAFWDLVGSPTMCGFMAARPATCSGCPREDECLGGCKAASEACFGSPTATDPFVWAYQDQASRPTA